MLNIIGGIFRIIGESQRDFACLENGCRMSNWRTPGTLIKNYLRFDLSEAYRLGKLSPREFFNQASKLIGNFRKKIDCNYFLSKNNSC